jgi:hypothetical protein
LGATYYVVASDAPASIKAWAKAVQDAGGNVFVCDGTADNVEIQAAIDALSTTGGEIYLIEGTFILNATLNIDYSHITLNGTLASILKLGNGLNTHLILINSGTDKIISDVCIRNLQLDGNRTNQTDATTSTDAYTKAIIRINGSDTYYTQRIVIENNYIHDSAGVLVIFYSATRDSKILNNYLTGAPYDSVLLMWSNNCRNLIHGNTIRDVGYGVGVSSSWENVISNNNFESVINYMMIVDGGDSKDNIIIGNTFREGVSNCRGIDLAQGSSRTLISSNNFYKVRKEAIYVDRSFENIIEINSMKDCGSYAWAGDINAIEIFDDGTTLSRWNIISNNDIRGISKYGISISATTSTPNYIYNNYLIGNNTGAIYLISGITGIVIRDNYGYVTENSGTTTIVSGQTHVHVTHGLATTPTRVQVTLRNNPTTAPGVVWVDTLGATEFIINCTVDPSTTGAIFDWRAQVGEG